MKITGCLLSIKVIKGPQYYFYFYLLFLVIWIKKIIFPANSLQLNLESDLSKNLGKQISFSKLIMLEHACLLPPRNHLFHYQLW